MAELKGRDQDVKAVRAVLKLRKQDPDERQEAEAILEPDMNALRMVRDGAAPPLVYCGGGHGA